MQSGDACNLMQVICPAPDSFFPKQFPRRHHFINRSFGLMVCQAAWSGLFPDDSLQKYASFAFTNNLFPTFSAHSYVMFFLSYFLHLKEPPSLWTFCCIFKRKPPVIPRKNSITFNTPERDRQWKKHCECNKWDSRLVNSTLSARHHAAPADAEAGCSAPQTCCRTFN